MRCSTESRAGPTRFSCAPAAMVPTPPARSSASPPDGGCAASRLRSSSALTPRHRRRSSRRNTSAPAPPPAARSLARRWRRAWPSGFSDPSRCYHTGMSEAADDSTDPSPGAAIQREVAVRLTERVWRITAANPGAMTGAGTNSYLVRCGGQATVIDPGPADEHHVQALIDAACGPIHYILVTHTHQDHSPAAMLLKSATGALLLGRKPHHHHWQDPTFAPDRELRHGDRLTLAGATRLRVIHTPGHASNHLCFLLEEERILFTGDHIIQGSTVVIDPPDGDMAAYLRSLESLLHEPLDSLAPGHGTLILQPHAAIEALIQHRLRREAKVLASLPHQQPDDLPTLVRRVYDDVPPQLHSLAERSLLAHLLKLEAEARARRVADRWIAPN